MRSLLQGSVRLTGDGVSSRQYRPHGKDEAAREAVSATLHGNRWHLPAARYKKRSIPPVQSQPTEGHHREVQQTANDQKESARTTEVTATTRRRDHSEGYNDQLPKHATGRCDGEQSYDKKRRHPSVCPITLATRHKMDTRLI